MITSRSKVFEAINQERGYQDLTWGSVTDRPKEVGSWLSLMRVILTKGESQWASSTNDHQALDCIRELTAVGCACMEQHGAVLRSETREHMNPVVGSPFGKQPTGFVAVCRCGVAMAAMDINGCDREEAATVIGGWMMEGMTVEPRFGRWQQLLGPACKCAPPADTKGGAS